MRRQSSTLSPLLEYLADMEPGHMVAALGMAQGIFLSNLGLRANSNLRRRQLMTITDENRNADASIFFVALVIVMATVSGLIYGYAF